MKFYDFQTKEFKIIDKKEQVTENMISVTDEEQYKILDALNNKQEVYLKDGEIRISSTKPFEWCYWSDKYKEWRVDEDLKQKFLKEHREQKWEEIQKFRDAHQGTGVFVESLGKWFHTDQRQIINYLAEQLFVNVEGYSEHWKTMTNEYVVIDKEKFWDIVKQVYKKGKADFFNAENHRKLLQESEDPLNYNYQMGWQMSFDPDYKPEELHEIEIEE